MNKVKVLLVDDEVDYLSMMEMRIESWGYDVLVASEGKEALAIIKEELPDIAILDFSMPGMDGVELLKEIRKFAKKLPVIMLTAHSEVKNIQDAKKLGVSSFIPKLSAYSDTQNSLMVALDMAQKKDRG